jgi:16S rRNA (guanine527-N7)-methyltransferase
VIGDLSSFKIVQIPGPMIRSQIIHSYFPNLSSRQTEQFENLYELYKEWNSKINVISRKDIDSLYEHHVLHSLGIAKVTGFKDGTKILDVGTGGGFPGIPLAILFPQVQFFLVDSIGKKIKVVQEVSGALGLQNVKAEQKRVEELKEQFDFIVSRAVTVFPEFYHWVKHKTSSTSFNELKNGILYLKGGELAEELKSFNRAKIYSLKDYFKEDFFETKKLVYLPLK